MTGRHPIDACLQWDGSVLLLRVSRKHLTSSPVTSPCHPPYRAPSAPAARAVDLTKVYGAGDTRVVALDAVTCAFERGRFTAIMGPSGSGKSTLMHCMAGLDTATVRVGLHRRRRPDHASTTSG